MDSLVSWDSARGHLLRCGIWKFTWTLDWSICRRLVIVGVLVHASTPKSASLYGCSKVDSRSNLMHQNAGDFWVFKRKYPKLKIGGKTGPKAKTGVWTEGRTRRINQFDSGRKGLGRLESPKSWMQARPSYCLVWWSLVNSWSCATGSQGSIALQDWREQQVELKLYRVLPNWESSS